MLLSKLKAVCAAYHKKVVADLTVNSEDLFLAAWNNAQNNAQNLHNFELTRIVATLSIDGQTGGSLLNATILNNGTETITVAGTLSPDATGVYTVQGTFGGYPLYVKAGATTYFCYYNATVASYILAATLSTGAVTNKWLPSPDILVPAGSYVGGGANTGTATVTNTTSALWSGIKEIVAIQRSGVDGNLMALDFTRADVPIERDRYELEMTDEYGCERRYPSDAQLLSRGTSGSVILRGQSLYIYPLATITTTPLSVTLEAYGQLADLTATNLSDVVPSNFFLQHGAQYFQWAIICELNYYFQTFVPRQEGVISAPEQKKEEAWRDLLLWDTYLIDPNSSRSR